MRFNWQTGAVGALGGGFLGAGFGVGVWPTLGMMAGGLLLGALNTRLGGVR